MKTDRQFSSVIINIFIIDHYFNFNSTISKINYISEKIFSLKQVFNKIK